MRQLPIHVECERGASDEAINSLLTANPDGVRGIGRNRSTDLDLVLLLLNRRACPNIKDNGGRTPRQVAGTLHDQSDSRKTIRDIVERWRVLMAIKLLRKLRVFHWADVSMTDLYEYIGQEEAFLAANSV